MFLVLIDCVLVAAVVYVVKRSQVRMIASRYEVHDEARQQGHGNLLICSHEYEHVDLFVVSQELFLLYSSNERDIHSVLDSNVPTHILLADRTHNYLFASLCIPRRAQPIYVKKGTVSKMRRVLEEGENLVVFLYPAAEGTGIYHLLRECGSLQNPPHVHTARIHCSTPRCKESHIVYDALKKTMLSKFSLSYTVDSALSDCVEEEEAASFMELVKRELYPARKNLGSKPDA